MLASLLVACAGEPAPAAVSPPAPAVQAPAAPLAAPVPPSLRLPSLARPRRYDLELWLDPRTPTFHGTIGIDLDVLQPTTLLWSNATNLGVDDAKLEASAGTQVARVVPGGSDFVGFVFDREVPPGKARLTIAYHGAVDEERSRAIYAAREGDGEPYIYTFFEPIDARRAFPCFDEPSYKVPWKLSLHVPKGDIALANAPVAREHDEPGAKLVEMAESEPLPSYLVAFVVGPFDVLEASTAGHSGTPLRFIVPKGRGAETAYAAGITPKIIGALEDYFGMPYPYGKLDVAVVPRFWGTMEHPGIVALGQPLTLIRPSELGVEREQLYTDIAAHELAHYWFGDYVTTAWWDDTWLNEALGEWMDAKVTETLEPGWRFDLERLDRTAYGMRGDALTTAKKIRQPVESKDDIQSSFDAAITYEKGQAVLSMFEAWMTPPRFQHAIRAYMASHAWKNATAEDFFAALDAEQPGAGDAMKTFVEQPGFPSITLEAKCSGANVALDVHQRRYRPLGAEVPAEVWKIPVCVRYPKERAAGGTGRACTLLSTETATIPLETRTCPAWILGNADGAGYYEVAYTPAQLRGALSRSANATTVERLAALRDAAALVASGDLPLADALALAKDTAESHERQVVHAGFDLVNLARSSAMNDAEVRRRAGFLRAVYGRRAKELGLARRRDEGVDAELLRPDMVHAVAVSGADEALRKRAHGLAFEWLKDEGAMAPELVEPVLAAAAKSNDETLFAALLDRAKAEKDHAKVSRLLRALGAFTAPALVRRADGIVAGTTFDVRDTFSILVPQFADPTTRDLAWEFIKTSFDAVSSRMRSDEVLFEYFRVVQGFCDEAHQKEVAEFFAGRAPHFDGGPRALANAVESIGQCAAIFHKNQAGLDAFLSKY